jgi:SH3-like domain-containing protein
MKKVNFRAILTSVAVFFALLYPTARALPAESGPVPSAVIACEGSVYTIDTDPKGTNVRSAPDKNSPVLEVIPYDFEGTEAELAGSLGDWVLIRSAQGATTGFVLQKKGWVYASLLAVRAVHPSGRKVALYSEPDTGGPVVKMVTGDTEAGLEGCTGHWMRVRIGKEKGWLAWGDHCGNPVTTCP